MLMWTSFFEERCKKNEMDKNSRHFLRSGQEVDKHKSSGGLCLGLKWTKVDKKWTKQK